MKHDEQAREIIRAFNVDHAGNRVANVTDLLEQIVGKAIEEAVAAEREAIAKFVGSGSFACKHKDGAGELRVFGSENGRKLAAAIRARKP